MAGGALNHVKVFKCGMQHLAVVPVNAQHVLNVLSLVIQPEASDSGDAGPRGAFALWVPGVPHSAFDSL